MIRARLAVLACGVAMTSVLAAQNALVVDWRIGPYRTLQDAVTAAAPGDTVLVRAGTYASVTIGTPLTIVADAGAKVRIAGTVTVRGVRSGSVRLHGLVGEGQSFTAPPVAPGLVIDDCDAAVWVEDCTFRGNWSLVASSNGGCLVTDSHDVVLLDSKFVGGSDLGSSSGSSVGLTVRSGEVQILDCSIVGGTRKGAAGGVGLEVLDSAVYLRTSAVRGGPGSPAAPLQPGTGCFFPASPGGDGMQVSGSSSCVRLASVAVEGGRGGAGYLRCPPAVAGRAIQVLAGQVSVSDGDEFRVAAAEVVRERDGLDYVVTGPVGGAVALVFAGAPASVFVPAIQAPLLVPAATSTAIPVGVLPDTGQLTFSLTVPELGPGVMAASIFAQVLGLGAAGRPSGGSGQATSLLDRSF